MIGSVTASMTRTEQKYADQRRRQPEYISVKIVHKQHDGAKDNIASGITHPVTNLFSY